MLKIISAYVVKSRYMKSNLSICEYIKCSMVSGHNFYFMINSRSLHEFWDMVNSKPQIILLKIMYQLKKKIKVAMLNVLIVE